jgi:hypothetical protein
MRGTSVVVLGLIAISCIGPQPVDPLGYRLSDSGDHWDVSRSDRVFEDLQPRYAEFFDIILDPTKGRLPDLRPLRDDLERSPVDRRNYDALNAVAIAYYETNFRAESGRGDGLVYLALSQRSAKLLAVPWRAYGEIEESALRTAILDFFEDAASGRKLMSEATAPRLLRIVASLEKKEPDVGRIARIQEITASLERQTAALQAELDGPERESEATSSLQD